MKTAVNQQSKHQYGLEVIEFFKADQNELQPLLDKASTSYLNGVESSFNQSPAANVPFIAEPLVVALAKLHEKQLEGYTIRQDKYCGIRGIVLDVTLMKPEATLAAELSAIHAEITEQYEADRFERNKAETERQVQITLDRSAREAEKAAAEEQARIDAEKAAVEAAARSAALADLIEAYTK